MRGNQGVSFRYVGGPLGSGSTGGTGLKSAPGRWPTYLDAGGRAITTTAGSSRERLGTGVYRHRVRIVNETHVQHEYRWVGTKPAPPETGTAHPLIPRHQESTCSDDSEPGSDAGPDTALSVSQSGASSPSQTPSTSGTAMTRKTSARRERVFKQYNDMTEADWKVWTIDEWLDESDRKAGRPKKGRQQ